MALFLANTVLAQRDVRRATHAGRDFWITLDNGGGDHAVVYITGSQNASITFQYTALGTTRNYTLTGGTILEVPLEIRELVAISGAPAEQVRNKSLHIYSDQDIVVQFELAGITNDDGMLVYPSDNQLYGSDYYFNGAYNQNSDSNGVGLWGAFSIVSRADSVLLEITPAQTTWSHPQGIPFTVALRKGETYKLVCHAVSWDLSGTKVKVLYASSCNPVNVFITYVATIMSWPFRSRRGCCADRMLEQVLPVSAWDTVYPVVTFANNPYNVIKIVSAADNNTVFFDGVPIRTMASGGIYDTIIRGTVVISSTDKISVTQHMLSNTETRRGSATILDSMSDPASLWVIPLKEGFRETHFKALNKILFNYAPAPPFYQDLYPLNRFTLISKAANVGTVIMNGTGIGPLFVPFPNNPGYMYANVRMDTTITYHITSQDPIVGYFIGACPFGSSVFSLGDLSTQPIPVDTAVLCDSGSVQLRADTAATYLWSDGSTGQTITVTDTGLYEVHMQYPDDCIGGWTGAKQIRVLSRPNDWNSLQDTLDKCLREERVLTANVADHYLWANGSIAQQIRVTAWDSTYTVIEYYQCRRVRHHFTVLPKPPYLVPFSLGADTTLCNDDQLTLTVEGGATRWSDGTTGSQLVVTRPGVYWAYVRDTCLEQMVSDTIAVRYMNCPKDCRLAFPTAFTPNGDGHNDVFRPVYSGDFARCSYSIYNRWGEKVYQTQIKEQGWDGVHRGVPADLGTYFYLCTYQCSFSEEITLKGEFTLIR